MTILPQLLATQIMISVEKELESRQAISTRQTVVHTAMASMMAELNQAIQTKRNNGSSGALS